MWNWITNSVNFILNGIISALKAGIDFLALIISTIELFLNFCFAKIIQCVTFLLDHHLWTGFILFLLVLKFCPKTRQFMQKSLIGMIQFGMRCLGLRIVTDSVHLASGSHELKVDLGRQPLNVWVTLDDQEAIPVCQGSIDKVGVQLGDTFFVLYADVSSSARSVRWLAIIN